MSSTAAAKVMAEKTRSSLVLFSEMHSTLFHWSRRKVSAFSWPFFRDNVATAVIKLNTSLLSVLIANALVFDNFSFSFVSKERRKLSSFSLKTTTNL